MATVDRFKDMLKSGSLLPELGGNSLTAQAKYDFLAAVHTMEQIENVQAIIAKRSKKRAEFKKKFAHTVKNTLQNLLDKEDEEIADAQNIESAVKALLACHNELLKLEGEEKEDAIIAELVKDGVTAK